MLNHVKWILLVIGYTIFVGMFVFPNRQYTHYGRLMNKKEHSQYLNNVVKNIDKIYYQVTFFEKYVKNKNYINETMYINDIISETSIISNDFLKYISNMNDSGNKVNEVNGVNEANKLDQEIIGKIYEHIELIIFDLNNIDNTSVTLFNQYPLTNKVRMTFNKIKELVHIYNSR